MESPKTLLEAITYFADTENCRQFMISVRWPDGKVRCPHCNAEKVTYLAKAKVYRCYGDHAKQKFSLKVGTIFEDSPIGLEKWLPAVWLIVNCKNGISSWELHRTLGVTQKSAWFMLHRIRLAMKSGTFTKLGGEGGGGPVEADETFVGPDPRRMHKSRRAKILALAASDPNLNQRAPGKTIVMGMLDRNLRQVRAMVVPNVKRVTLQEKILNNVHGGSQIITDDFPTYKYALADKFAHDVINHVEGYVQGQVHTNGIENFWSLLKRGLRGTYVAVEPFHLDRYVDEQVFRFNHRATKDNPLNDSNRFHMAMSQIAGKRLTYAELTGKTQERPL
jgi:transposase-like protein